jgi:hypothetical protein
VELWSTAKADTEFSLFIRERDKWCFFGCGNRATQNSHFFGRGNSATRYDPDNCDGACAECHAMHEGNKNGVYKELKIEQLGSERFRALEIRARSTYPRSKAIYDCMVFLGVAA